MKTQILSFLFAVLISGTALASKPISLEVDSHTLNLDLLESARFGAKISITNDAGQVIHSDKVLAGTTTKKYNLSKLAKGYYSLIIENNTMVFNQAFEINNQGISTSKEGNETFKPSVRFENGLVYLSTLTLGNTAAVSIYDTNGTVILNELYKQENIVNKIYSIDQLPLGDYIISVKNGTNTFTYNIKK